MDWVLLVVEPGGAQGTHAVAASKARPPADHAPITQGVQLGPPKPGWQSGNKAGRLVVRMQCLVTDECEDSRKLFVLGRATVIITQTLACLETGTN